MEESMQYRKVHNINRDKYNDILKNTPSKQIDPILQPKKVKINGIVYESIASASLSLDCTRKKISEGLKALEKTKMSSIQLSIRRIEQLTFEKV